MGSDFPPCSNNADEEYIDMEVSSGCSNSSRSTNPEPKSREFEFQMSAASSKTDSTPSPADELFYKGKLLPLHLPPRLQMVEKLLCSSSFAFEDKKEAFDEQCEVLLGNATTLATALSTPLESCSISPSESCRASSELSPDEYFFDWSVEISSFISHDDQKKAWSKKLLQIKESTLGLKFKASKTFLKSLFTKFKCPEESCARAPYSAESGSRIQVKECLNPCIKVNKIATFGLIKGRYKKNNTETEMPEDGIDRQRRSFSGALNWHNLGTRTSSSHSSSSSSSGSSSISSSFSSNLNRFCDLELQTGTKSANYELESPIEGAIAHCKQSHNQDRF